MNKYLSSKLTLTVYIAFVSTAAGCTDHVLTSLDVDGGASSDGPNARAPSAYDLAPQVDVVHEDAASEAGQGSGADAGPGAPEVAPDAPHAPDVREARESGPESDARSRPDVGWETKSDVAPDLPSGLILDGGPSGCTAYPSTAILAELPSPPAPSTFRLHGDTIFVAFKQQPGSDVIAPTYMITTVSVSTGKTTTFSLGSSLPNRVAVGTDALFYIQGEAMAGAGGGWLYGYPDVARLDLATGQVSIVDSELFPTAPSILSLVGNANGEVFWSMVADPKRTTAVIRRWDEATRSTQSTLQIDQAAAVLADQDHLYWAGLTSSDHMAFFSASTAGGPISVIKEWPSALADAPTLLALDDQSLYYTLLDSTPPGLYAIPKGGGEIRAVAAGAKPGVIGSQTIDDTYVYWGDYADLNNIQRAPKTGDGTVETISTGATNYLTDLAVDRCNLYWIASDKNRVLARAK